MNKSAPCSGDVKVYEWGVFSMQLDIIIQEGKFWRFC